MKNILTFIIPVRHPRNAKNWAFLKSVLKQTLGSISAQTQPGWKAVVVANRGSDLPPIPAGVEVNWVDFPPNPISEQGTVDNETFYQSIRIDVGRRALSGMIFAGQMGHVMRVDDDDLVSRKLAAFVAEHSAENGWYVRDGYLWSSGGSLLYSYSDFSKVCGTSHIIRSDLYQLPKTAQDVSETYIKEKLGSHHFLRGFLEANGTPIVPLPFAGAVYRIGHSSSHTKTGDLRRQYFPRSLVKKPIELGRRLARLRWITPGLRREFFGGR